MTATIDIDAPALPPGVTLRQAAAWPDTAEACRQLGCVKRTVSRMIRRGQLRCYLVFGRRRFDPRDLAAGVGLLTPRAKGGKPERKPPTRKRPAAGGAFDRVFGRRDPAPRKAG